MNSAENHSNTNALTKLLATVDPKASLAQRNLQLIALLDWVRGDSQSAEAATARVAELVTMCEQSPVLRERPQTLSALGEVSGVGERKLERYGEAFLGVLGARAA